MLDRKPVVDVALMRKHGCIAQCCASYPPADRYVDGFDPMPYRRHLGQRAIGGMSRPLQLYIHAPRVPVDHLAMIDASSLRGALWDIEREIALVDKALLGSRRVLKLHCFGRSGADWPSRIIDTLQGCFDFDQSGEYSIELDPSRDRIVGLERLRTFGFNRIGIRVAAIPASKPAAHHHTEFSPAEAQALIGAARVAGFRGIDVDLAYGDRGQAVEEFQALMESVVALAPDRVTLVADPLCSASREALCAGSPQAEHQIARLRQAVEGLDAAGYVHVALGHFSLPGDRLAVASRSGSLARSYCSYSVGVHCDRIAFGPGAISNVGPVFVQNAADPERYRALLDGGLVPIERGIQLSTDQLMRKAIIDALACQGEVSKDSISAAYMIEFDRHFASELEALDVLAADGVVELDHDWIAITPRGQLLAGAVGNVFDPLHGRQAGH